MLLRFKALFWSGIALFLVVIALAGWGLFELKSVMHDRRSANNLQMTLHSMLESLQEADIVFLLSRNNSSEEQVKRVVGLVNLAHQKSVALTRMDTPSEEIHKRLTELEILIKSKVKTEDEYMVSGDMEEGPVVRKVTTMKDNLVLTDLVQDKIERVDHLLIDYQSKHLVYVDKYFDLNIASISFGVLISFALFLLFAQLVAREIDRRTKLEGELRRAQEAAISASALKSQFLATVSHEVRTPLNGIIGMSELIRNQAQGEVRKFAGVINDSGKGLLRIVNDLLDFSRIEANRMELELQEVKLSSLIESAADLFSTTANEKRLALYATYPPAFENLYAADGARIAQILHNLIGNALKFTSAGSVHVSGEVVGVEGSEYKMRVTVQDTGSGIAEEKVKMIFQPFEQAASEHQRAGTGLGLSISKRLAEMMSGSIHFVTQEGKGSAFWFEIPLRLLKAGEPARRFAGDIYAFKTSPPIEAALQDYARQLGVRFHAAAAVAALPAAGARLCCTLASVRDLPADLQKEALVIDFPQADATPSAWRFLGLPLTPDRFAKSFDAQTQPEVKGASPSPSQALIPRGNGLILVVEDNATNQMLVQTQLEQLGYRVHIAENGEECLKAMRRANYDLILMDCRMPVMDGFETTKAIRERELRRQSLRVPVIAITANAVEGDRNRCLAAGMDDYITKPIDLPALHQMIQKWIAAFNTSQIDWRVVSDLANRTNNEVVKRLIHSFQNTLSTGLVKMDEGLQSEDWKEISSVAHQLKSSGAALGAVNLSHICAQIEDDIESRKKTEVALCEQLKAVGRRVLEELAAQSRYS